MLVQQKQINVFCPSASESTFNSPLHPFDGYIHPTILNELVRCECEANGEADFQLVLGGRGGIFAKHDEFE